MRSFILTSVVIMNFFMISAVMLSVITQSAIVLIVMAPLLFLFSTMTFGQLQ